MTIDAILDHLASPGESLSAANMAGLASLSAEDTERFAAVWRSLDVSQRERLLHQLSDLAEDNVELNFDAVFLLALRDEEAEVRRAAIHGLWEHEGQDIVDPLIDLLRRDPDAGVRAEAALALGRFVLQGEFEALPASVSARIDAALRRAIADEEEVVEVRGRALEAIGARSDDWVRDLIQDAYDDPERRMRISAVHAMGRSCDPDWLPTLVTEVGSEDPEMRFEAAGALGSLAEPDTTEYVLPLVGDEDHEVQEAAIAALGEIGGEEAIEALQELAANPDERIREAASAALDIARFSEDPLGVSV